MRRKQPRRSKSTSRQRSHHTRQRDIGLVQPSLLRSERRQHQGEIGHRLHGTQQTCQQTDSPIRSHDRDPTGNTSGGEILRKNGRRTRILPTGTRRGKFTHDDLPPPTRKFCYLRAPMGLNASSDEWCCHSDVIIRGLPWARKIVDDTVIWAATEPELLDCARIVLQRCRENNITIYQKKLELSNKIKFAGHIISDEGYKLDNDKFTAIANFPHHKNL